MSGIRQNLMLDIAFTVSGNLFGEAFAFGWTVDTDCENVQ